MHCQNIAQSVEEEEPEDRAGRMRPVHDGRKGKAEGLRTYVCKSCGGEIVGDVNTAATACPFCGSPVVMTGNLSGVLKPDYVIPFKLDKKAAKEKLKQHLQANGFCQKLLRRRTISVR